MNRLIATHLFAAALLVFATQSRADLLLIGDYDSTTTNANQVDQSATSDANANQLSLATFEAQVEAAFTTMTGGVATFDQAGDSVPDSNPQDLYFADNTVLATLTRTSSSTGIQSNSTNRTPVSGNSGFGGTTAFGFTFDPAHQIVSVGLTVLSRADQAAGTATVTATFADADGLNAQNVAASDTLSGVNASDDTFFGFSAPAGKYLTGVTVTTPYFTWIDDLGVVTVPEPGALGLSTLGALLIAARRRG